MPIGPVDLHDLVPGGLQDPLQTEPKGAGAFHPDLGDLPVAGDPALQALEPSGVVGKDLAPSSVPIPSMTAAT